ncbi:MAG: heavy-metal-associated domain-containing protein [Rhodoferax sp.]|nr:heavy-metal-associated domain-containing protein [Rhodoferax sp.]
MQHTLTVTGMTCGHCEAAVKNAILEIDPQAQVVIDRPTNTVQVDTNHAPEALAAAIREEGYDVA